MMAAGASDRTRRAFVSYSREDTSIVSPLVKLLRTSHQEVFQDIDSISPGRKWQGELDTAIRESTTFLVFWCNHAASSTWVHKECHAAMQGGLRTVVPVVLDETPLSIGLEHYQYIDLRALGLHERSHLSAPRRVAFLAVSVVVAILAATAFLLTRTQDMGVEPGPTQDSVTSVSAILALIGIIVLVLLAPTVWRSLRRRAVRRRAADRIAEGVVAAGPG